MTLPEAKALLLYTLLCLVVMTYVYSEESCYRFRRKENVTIDPNQCLWENYTEPKPRRFCLQSCINNDTCTGMGMVEGQIARQCCFLNQTQIRYRQPGNQIVYYWKHADLLCQERWNGSNCDACAQRWSGANCNACAPGWTGEDCDNCADGFLNPTCDQICDGFGCCNHDNCQGCIQNGGWKTAVGYEVYLTFKGERCSELVPGTEVIIFSYGTITGGYLNEMNHTLSFTDGTYAYECRTTEDKNFNATLWNLSSPNEKSRLIFSYVYPTAK